MSALPLPTPSPFKALPRLERKFLLPPHALATRVSEKWGVTVEALLGWDRGGHVSEARKDLVRQLRFHTHMSYPEIGTYLGGRDHTTIMYLAGRRRK